MARIRSIHPGIFTDEAFMVLSSDARTLLFGIWCHAWDDGVFEWKPVQLKVKIFPYNNVAIDLLLDELEDQNLVQRFGNSGKEYAVIRNFQKYQRPKKPSVSNVLPDELKSFAGCKSGSSTPVPDQFGTGGEKSPQKGGREEGRKGGVKKTEPKGSQKKGTRLPDDWTPSEKNFQDAQACGLTTDEVRHEADRFRDYWIAATGARATKRDWDATFRNWCRNSLERKPKRGYQQQQHPLAQAFDELSNDIRRAENRSEPVPTRQTSDDGATVIELTAVGGRNHGWPEAGRTDSAEDGDNPLRLFPVERFR